MTSKLYNLAMGLWETMLQVADFMTYTLKIGDVEVSIQSMLFGGAIIGVLLFIVFKFAI